MIIRGVVEFTRLNPMVIGPISVSHMMGFIGIIIGMIIIKYKET